jgi:hypothetical protein
MTLLLELEADVNAPDLEGNSALMRLGSPRYERHGEVITT